jgi:hypothetical protein
LEIRKLGLAALFPSNNMVNVKNQARQLCGRSSTEPAFEVIASHDQESKSEICAAIRSSHTRSIRFLLNERGFRSGDWFRGWRRIDGLAIFLVEPRASAT